MAALKDDTISKLEAAVSRLDGMMELIISKMNKIDGMAEAIARLEEQSKVSSNDREEIKKKVDSLAKSESAYIKEDGNLFQRVFLKREPILYFILGGLVLHGLLPKNIDITTIWEMVKKLIGL